MKPLSHLWVIPIEYDYDSVSSKKNCFLNDLMLLGEPESCKRVAKKLSGHKERVHAVECFSLLFIAIHCYPLLFIIHCNSLLFIIHCNPLLSIQC